MGQPVRIVEKRVLRPDVVRFDIDRSLTGTDHERYDSPPDSSSPRPPDVLAGRLFASGWVKTVHVFSNSITITFSAAVENSRVEEVERIIEELFIHYRPGVKPTAV